MARCKECLYYEVCPLGLAIKGKTGTCLKFKNKADFVEVVRCKDCGMKGAAFCMAGDVPLTKETKNNFCSYGVKNDFKE